MVLGRRQRTPEVGQGDQGSSSSEARRVGGRFIDPSLQPSTEVSYSVTPMLPVPVEAARNARPVKWIPRVRRW
jgi:hypothetical protein